jgi:hypothetical protein
MQLGIGEFPLPNTCLKVQLQGTPLTPNQVVTPPSCRAFQCCMPCQDSMTCTIGRASQKGTMAGPPGGMPQGARNTGTVFVH